LETSASVKRLLPTAFTSNAFSSSYDTTLNASALHKIFVVNGVEVDLPI
jgi:hypothetical protein